MGWDYEREKEKNEELKADISEFLTSGGYAVEDAGRVSSLVLKHYVSTSPPEKEEVLLEYIAMNSFSGRDGGKSVKAGNIRLNIGKLFEALSAGVFTTISAVTAPWAIPFAALLLWRSIWNAAEVPLSESEVVVLWNLHKMKNHEKLVQNDEPKILAQVNEHLKKYDSREISLGDLRHAISNLERIDSIEKTSAKEWFIKEWVRVSYT